ncbi:hypothetical protein [Catenulispora pinistramenti]
MATRTHFSLSHLSNVEAGRRAPTADLIAAYEQEIRVRRGVARTGPQAL